MEYAPEVYDADDNLQRATSGRFLRTVQKRSTGTQVDLIVDLGSGVGNVTKLIADQFRSSTVIGLDIAAEMVKYATNKYPDIAFVVADSGSPWNQFKQLTGVVEHSVDLVVSTYMIQFLCTEGQRINLVNNVRNMLKDGGQGHFLFPTWCATHHLFESYFVNSKYSDRVKTKTWPGHSDDVILNWSNICSKHKMDIVRSQVSRIAFVAKRSFLAVIVRLYLRSSCHRIFHDESELVADCLEHINQNLANNEYDDRHCVISKDSIKFDIDLFEFHVKK